MKNTTDTTKMLKKDVTGLTMQVFQAHIRGFIKQHGTVGFKYDIGSKYVRVWSTLSNGQDSCYCFVDRETGDIYKSASWRAPAKHSRGNIFDGFNNPVMYGVGEYGADYLK